jgi:hypothetical protein
MSLLNPENKLSSREITGGTLKNYTNAGLGVKKLNSLFNIDSRSNKEKSSFFINEIGSLGSTLSKVFNASLPRKTCCEKQDKLKQMQKSP